MREKFKFRGFMKAFKNFAEYIIAFIFAKFKYFAKQIIYLESPDDLTTWGNLSLSKIIGAPAPPHPFILQNCVNIWSLEF